MLCISKAEAVRQSLDSYYTGKPCAHGETASRLVKSGRCQCAKCLAHDREYIKQYHLKRRADPAYVQGCRAKSRKHAAMIRSCPVRNEVRRTKNNEFMCGYSAREDVKGRAVINAAQRKLDPEVAARDKRVKQEWSQRDDVKSRRSLARNSRLKTDLNYRLECVARSYVSRCVSALKREKGGTTFAILGYSADQLRIHLESEFRDGMTWENHGVYWHIDHIASIAELARCGVRDIAKINALSNLQPKLASLNIAKGDGFELGVSICE